LDSDRHLACAVSSYSLRCTLTDVCSYTVRAAGSQMKPLGDDSPAWNNEDEVDNEEFDEDFERSGVERKERRRRKVELQVGFDVT
jgi:hypothetical protein